MTISIPKQIQEIKSYHNYSDIWKQLYLKGRDVYGQRFSLHDEDAVIILKLLIYFLKDEDLARQYRINLFKGIMLTGPVGCGKTTLMNLMRYFLQPQHRYTIKPCRDIAMEFAKEGYEILQRFTKKSYNTYTDLPFTFCFDDLGLEQVTVQHYGNACNTMAEVLLSRYDHFMLHSMLTHVTTNLSASEIETIYGIRVRSRLREMFNLIAFDSAAKDKRI